VIKLYTGSLIGFDGMTFSIFKQGKFYFRGVDIAHSTFVQCDMGFM